MRMSRLLAALAVLLGAPIPAGAVTDTNFTYSAYKLGSFNIDACGVVSFAGGGITCTFGGRLTYTNPSGHYINVDLPENAWIYGVEIAYSSGAGSDPHFVLFRNDFTIAVPIAVVSKTLTEDSEGPVRRTYYVTANNLRLVDRRYSYRFQVTLGSEDSFYGARVLYHYNSAGD